MLLLRGAVADTITLAPTKDNTLYEDAAGALSNGAGDNFFAGRTGTGFIRRGLIAFDVAANIPAGATIDSVCLTLHLSRTNPFFGGPEVVELHRVLADWGEAGSDAFGGEGSGTLAAPGDATWLHTFFDTTAAAAFWSSAGGDFSPTVSAGTLVDTLSAADSLNFYRWAGPQMAADVQSMLDDFQDDFGWMVVGNENASFSTKRFDAREDTTESFRPALFVAFTVAPTAVDPVAADGGFELHASFPNPFNPATTITYTTDRRALVDVTIFDALGRRVRTLVRETHPPGRRSVVWNGRDDRGAAVSSGVYLVRLRSSGRVKSRKIVLLK